MLEVGCPEPALVDERIASTRSWAASSETVSRPVCELMLVVMTLPSRSRYGADLMETYPRWRVTTGSGQACRVWPPTASAHCRRYSRAADLLARPGGNSRAPVIPA